MRHYFRAGAADSDGTGGEVMGVYISGLEMPGQRPYETFRIYSGGTVFRQTMDGDYELLQDAQAVQLQPPIRRLIDSDALYKELSTVDDDTAVTVAEIKNLVLFFETAIPREDGKFCGTLY